MCSKIWVSLPYKGYQLSIRMKSSLDTLVPWHLDCQLSQSNQEKSHLLSTQQLEFAPLPVTATRFCLARQQTQKCSHSQQVVSLIVGSFYTKASSIPVCFSNTQTFFWKCRQPQCTELWIQAENTQKLSVLGAFSKGGCSIPAGDTLIPQDSDFAEFHHRAWGFPGGLAGKEPRRHKRQRFDPWVGKIPWRKKWQPIPVFLPEKFHGQRSLAGSMES